MPKKILFVLAAVMLSGICAVNSNAQAARKSVSAAEVNGTFRLEFTGKFKGSANEIKILALGGGKVRIGFDLTYPFVDGTGQLSANVGQADGTADISGDTAVYAPTDEYGDCRITVKFVKRGTIKVTQESNVGGCGFGFNVSAMGTYKKVSTAKPKF